jgi:tetratricopeptide (TPR) repeat protein
MDKHDRAAAFTAFEAALSVSPSSALTYILGSLILAFAGEAERAIEWADRSLRLSPFDPYRGSAFCAVSFAHFQRGRYGDAADAARKAIQALPRFSMCYVALAAPLAKLGQLEEAKAVGARVLELQPTFGYDTNFRNIGAVPSFVQDFGDALRAAGLPE